MSKKTIFAYADYQLVMKKKEVETFRTDLEDGMQANPIKYLMDVPTLQRRLVTIGVEYEEQGVWDTIFGLRRKKREFKDFGVWEDVPTIQSC